MNMRFSDLNVIVDYKIVDHLQKEQHFEYMIYCIVKSYIINHSKCKHQCYIHINTLNQIFENHYKSKKYLKSRLLKVIKNSFFFNYSEKDQRVYFISIYKIYNRFGEIPGRGLCYPIQFKLSDFRKKCLLPALSEAPYLIEKKSTNQLMCGRSHILLSKKLGLSISYIKKWSMQRTNKLKRFQLIESDVKQAKSSAWYRNELNEKKFHFVINKNVCRQLSNFYFATHCGKSKLHKHSVKSVPSSFMQLFIPPSEKDMLKIASKYINVEHKHKKMKVINI